MKKKETDMMTAKSKSRLSVLNSGVFDAAGNEIVIACSYNNDYKFGYFICLETVFDDGSYGYSNVHAFYPKENEQTFQHVLEEMKRLLDNL